MACELYDYCELRRTRGILVLDSYIEENCESENQSRCFYHPTLIGREKNKEPQKSVNELEIENTKLAKQLATIEHNEGKSPLGSSR
ncbi:MAG: hypothetical protein Q8P15_00375 [Nanoarchaeota archaeon]|nr:hypothetical protein [Nanoarchaeota archaeon]